MVDNNALRDAHVSQWACSRPLIYEICMTHHYYYNVKNYHTDHYPYQQSRTLRDAEEAASNCLPMELLLLDSRNFMQKASTSHGDGDDDDYEYTTSTKDYCYDCYDQ